MKNSMIISISLNLQDGPAYEEPATQWRRSHIFHAPEPVWIWLRLVDADADAIDRVGRYHVRHSTGNYRLQETVAPTKTYCRLSLSSMPIYGWSITKKTPHLTQKTVLDNIFPHFWWEMKHWRLLVNLLLERVQAEERHIA